MSFLFALLVTFESPAHAGIAYTDPAALAQQEASEQERLQAIDDCMHHGMDYDDWGGEIECVERAAPGLDPNDLDDEEYELEDCMIFDPKSCWEPWDVNPLDLDTSRWY